MVDVDKLKQLKKKLKTFKKVSQKDSEKGQILAKEIIVLTNKLLESKNLQDKTLNIKMIKNLNMSKDALNVYLDNLSRMDKLKKKWE